MMQYRILVNVFKKQGSCDHEKKVTRGYIVYYAASNVQVNYISLVAKRVQILSNLFGLRGQCSYKAWCIKRIISGCKKGIAM